MPLSEIEQQTEPKRVKIGAAGDLPPGAIEKFMPLVMELEDEGRPRPVVQAEDCTFRYVQHNNLYVVASTKTNANAALAFVFLHRLVKVCGLGGG